MNDNYLAELFGLEYRLGGTPIMDYLDKIRKPMSKKEIKKTKKRIEEFKRTGKW